MNGDKTNIPDYLNSRTNKIQMSTFFYCRNNKEADKRGSGAFTTRICSKFHNLFSGIGCFEGILAYK